MKYTYSNNTCALGASLTYYPAWGMVAGNSVMSITAGGNGYPGGTLNLPITSTCTYIYVTDVTAASTNLFLNASGGCGTGDSAYAYLSGGTNTNGMQNQDVTRYTYSSAIMAAAGVLTAPVAYDGASCNASDSYILLGYPLNLAGVDRYNHSSLLSVLALNLTYATNSKSATGNPTTAIVRGGANLAATNGVLAIDNIINYATNTASVSGHIVTPSEHGAAASPCIGVNY
jgi:hypothetical protein